MAKKKATSKKSQRRRGIEKGYRSGLEEDVAEQIKEAGFSVNYEDSASVIEYQKPPSKYTPDFVLPNGIIVETKGRFLGSDRTKHLLIQKQHPHLDIRFVFDNPEAKLNKGSKTRYRDWCDKHGFPWAKKRIPDEWFYEE